MLGAGTLQRSTTTGNNAEKLDTSREKNVPSRHKFWQGTTMDQKTTAELNLPAWQQLHAEARPSGGETLRAFVF